MKFSRRDKLDIIKNIESSGLAFDLDYERVVNSLEDFVNGRRFKLSNDGLDRTITGYKSYKNEDTGSMTFTRNYSDGTNELVDYPTYLQEYKFNFLPDRIKKLLKV